MSVELPRTDDWIHDRLAADAALTAVVADRIYADVAPQGVEMPFVLYQVQSPGPDRKATGARRVMVRPLYLVRGIAPATAWQGVLKTIADRIDTALDLAVGSAAGDATVIGCVREQAFRLVEEDGRTRHLGGLYRLWAQMAAA